MSSNRIRKTPHLFRGVGAVGEGNVKLTEENIHKAFEEEEK